MNAWDTNTLRPAMKKLGPNKKILVVAHSQIVKGYVHRDDAVRREADWACVNT
jgi:hypothetical protein